MDKVTENFKEFDQQGSGQIPRSIILRVLEELKVPESVAIRALDGSGQNAGDMVNYMEFLAWVGKASSSGQTPPFHPASRTNGATAPVSAQAQQQPDQLGGAREHSNAGKTEDTPSLASTATPGGPAIPPPAGDRQLQTRLERQEKEQEQAQQRQVVQQGQKEWKTRVERAQLAYKAGRLADAIDQIETAFSQRLGDDRNVTAVRLRSDIEAVAMVQDSQFRCGLALSSPYQGLHASWALARQQAMSMPLLDFRLVEQSMEAEWSLFSWEQRWSFIQRELPRLRDQREEARRRK